MDSEIKQLRQQKITTVMLKPLQKAKSASRASLESFTGDV
jgi:hypothetical protein